LSYNTTVKLKAEVADCQSHTVSIDVVS